MLLILVGHLLLAGGSAGFVGVICVFGWGLVGTADFSGGTGGTADIVSATGVDCVDR